MEDDKRNFKNTYWPRKIERKANWIYRGAFLLRLVVPCRHRHRREVECVLAENFRGCRAKRAGRGRVDLRLILLQTNAKPRSTTAVTGTVGQRLLTAASSEAVQAIVVSEGL